MSESETTLASFNVDKEAWKNFKKLTKDKGLSASYGLNELIKQALQRDSIFPIDTHNESIEDIDLSGYIKKSEFETVIASLPKPEPVNIDQLKDAVLNALTEPEKKQ